MPGKRCNCPLTPDPCFLKFILFHPIKALSARRAGAAKSRLAGWFKAMDELTREFLIESQEGLDRMEQCLTDLETRPQDAALLGEIFRSVHTIK